MYQFAYLDIIRVSFVGHRKLENPEEIKKKLSFKMNELLENSDLLIAHKIHDNGGTAACVKTAEKMGIPIHFI